MATYVLARRAALVAFGVWAVAGLSGCNTAPTPAVQSTASGFRIGAIAGQHGAVGRAERQSDRQLGAAGFARSARPFLRAGHGAGRSQRGDAQRPNRLHLPGRGRGRRPRPNERLGDAERRRGANPHHARAGDRGIHFQPGRSIVAGAGLAGQGAGLWRSPSRTRWRRNCGSEPLKSNRPRHCGRRAHIASCRGDVPWASRRVRTAAGGIRRPASHRPLSARAPARAVGS